MISLAHVTRDIFLLAHIAFADGDSGPQWENRLAEYFVSRGVRTDPLPGGTTMMGHTALSGLRHQVDGVLSATDGHMIAEWKSYVGALPKNELLRFRAVSDDYVVGLGSDAPAKALLRVFGGPGRYHTDVRRYAAIHGIMLIDPDRWPVPVILAGSCIWHRVGLAGPSARECRSLSSLVRPIQDVLSRRSDGSFLIPAPPSRIQLDSRLDLHDHWSDRLWEAIDESPGTFETLVAEMSQDRAA